jgi:tetratricopeptide (TPR) repeat protein
MRRKMEYGEKMAETNQRQKAFFCTECGAKLQGHEKFCANCGTKIGGQTSDSVVSGETAKEKAESLRISGDEYRMKNQFDEAIKKFDEAIKLDPNSVLAWQGRGEAYRGKNEYDKAIADCTKAIGIKPTAFAYGTRGESYRMKNEYDKAIADCTKAIGIEPNAFSYQTRGECYRMKNDHNKAISDLTEAINLNASSFSLGGRGAAYISTGQKHKAIADLERAVGMDSNNSFAKDQLKKARSLPVSGNAPDDDNDIDDNNVEDEDVVVDEDQEPIAYSPKWWFSEGNLYLARGEAEDAWESFNNALNAAEEDDEDLKEWEKLSDEEFTAAIFGRAQAADLLENGEDCVSDAKWAVENEPDNEEYKEFLDMMKSKYGGNTKAEITMERVLAAVGAGAKLSQVPEKFLTEDVYLLAVQNNGLVLDDVPDKFRTEKMCRAAIKQNGMALSSTPDKHRTKEMCLLAVENCGQALYYVPDNLKTKELCYTAVTHGTKKSGNGLARVPKEFLTPEFCLASVSNTGASLEYVPKEMITPEICLAAVKQDPIAINRVPPSLQTPELCKIAVEANGKLLEYVRAESQTLDVCLAAIKYENYAYGDDIIKFVSRDFMSKVKSFWNKAKKRYQECCDINETGKKAYSQGDYESALTEFTKSIELAGDDLAEKNYFFYRASTYSKMGKFDLAEKDMEQALICSPDNDKYLKILAKVKKGKDFGIWDYIE